MSKKILVSLAIMTVVGATAIGGTVAYFNDTETSVGNTFTAGTIDIAIDGENPWTKHYDTGDLKPGQTGNITFDIQNVGQNPVNVSKNLSNFVDSTGAVSEPECTVQGGVWNNEAKACDWGSVIDKNDVESQIIYDLYVEVYDNTDTKIWWQTIYTDAEGKTLSSVYPDANTYVALGMIPAGGHMIVKQSYHFDDDATNEYQGDTMAFDMTIKADQLPQGDDGITTVALENKVQGTDSIWAIVQDDSIQGTLNYKAQGPTFDYTFSGSVATTGSYTLLYVGNTNNYPCVGSIVLGSDTFTALTPKTITGSVDVLGNITNGKIWLIPTTAYDNVAHQMTSWPASDILFETGLINYVKN